MLGVTPRALAALGENDRSSTGYLPPEVFEATADRASADGDVAIVAHGGVGTLLLCALSGVEITRALDQPGHGHRFALERESRRVIHGWVVLPWPTPAG